MTTAVRPLALDDVVPEAHFRERHERRIAAPPAAVWDALHELRLSDLVLSRVLVEVRGLPARLLGRPRRRATTASLLQDPPVPVLGSDRGRAVVAGGVLQPWRLAGGEEPPELDAVALRAFSDPGWVKVGMDFVLEPDGSGTRLRTETRILATDPASRARFGLYWLAVRAGSSLIRRDMLRQVARRAVCG